MKRCRIAVLSQIISGINQGICLLKILLFALCNVFLCKESLYRHSKKMTNLFYALSILLSSCLAFNNPERVAKQHKREEPDYIKLDVDMINNEPIATFLIGSEQDKVSVIVDTGSSDLWIPSKSNVNCAPDNFKTNTSLDFQREFWGHMRNTYYINCSIYGTYDTTASNSAEYNDTYFSVVYSSFQYAYGSYLRENVAYENNDLGMINLAVANTSSEGIGVLGIGTPDMEYTAINYNYTYANFPFQLVNNNQIERAVYSIYLNESKGEFLFGAVDHSKYVGTPLRFPMIDPAEFKTYKIGAITMNALSIKKSSTITKLYEGYIPTLIDSGSASLQFPQKILKSLIPTLNLQKISDNIYITNCNSLKDKSFSFDFHGSTFDFPLIDNFTKTSGNQCVLNISFNSNDYFVLGNNFMKKYYTIFDWEDRTISIAKANDSTESKIESLDEPISAASPPLNATFGGSHTTFTQPRSQTTLATKASSKLESISSTSLSALGVQNTSYSMYNILLSLLLFV